MAGAPVKATWFDTKTLEDNLHVFESMVWRDYLKPQCVKTADQLRCNQNSWDRFDAAKSVWEYVSNFPYIAPPVGEELYQSFSSFMARPGGDCDNKTLVSCCLMLACGVPCRAVVIEVPNRQGKPSGEGHMYPEALIPGMGWVVFDPSRRMPPPSFPGHAVKGWVRARVDFTGKRPDGAAKNMRTGHSMMSAGLLTGAMLTGLSPEGQAYCGQAPTDPFDFKVWQDCIQNYDVHQGATPAATEEKPGLLSQFFGNILAIGQKRVEHDVLGPQQPAPSSVPGWVIPAVLLTIVGAVVLPKIMKRG